MINVKEDYQQLLSKITKIEDTDEGEAEIIAIVEKHLNHNIEHASELLDYLEVIDSKAWGKAVDDISAALTATIVDKIYERFLKGW